MIMFFAVYHFDKSNMDKSYCSYTGNVDYIETYDEIKIIPIIADLFGTITEFIKKRISDLENDISYQMTINMRLYYELNKANKYHKVEYGYLSGILHRYDKELIVEKLKRDGKTEEDILNVIKEDFNEEFNSLKCEYLLDIEIDKFSNFEEIIYAKERCKKVIKKETLKMN